MKATPGETADEKLNDSLALLIASTHSKTRPKSLVEIARHFEIAKNGLGGYRQVSERIGLSMTMVRQFASVLKLSPAVQELFERRTLDSVDAAVHLSLLPADEQLPIAQALASSSIDTADVRGIVQLRRAGNTSDISTLSKRVTDSKTKREYVAQFIIRGSQDLTRIRNLFSKYIAPEEIVSLGLDGALGTLVLTPKGKRSLTLAARQKKVSLKRIIPTLMQEEGER
jgi:hypothetical protein